MAIMFSLMYGFLFIMGIISTDKEVYTSLFVGAIICLGISSILFKLEKLDK